jgi:hypothetical protein
VISSPLWKVEFSHQYILELKTTPVKYKNKIIFLQNCQQCHIRSVQL